MRLGQDYQLTRIDISADSPVANKALRELDLKSWKVQILAIEHAGEFNPVPAGMNRLAPGDAVIVYGSASGVPKVFNARRVTRLTVMGMPVVGGSSE